MFVNAILHHEVPDFDEKIAKFFSGALPWFLLTGFRVAVALDRGV
jgi:hypothetical protein